MNTLKGYMCAVVATAVLVMTGCGADRTDINSQQKPSESAAGDARIDLEGQWELAGSNPEGCLAEWRFLENPTAKEKPLSFHETKEENVIQVWFGVYELQRDGDIRVTPFDPKGDPFTVNAIAKENTLQLRYDWNEKLLSCAYTKNGS